MHNMRRFLAIIIGIQLALVPVFSVQAADHFTSAGVGNPNAPATDTNDPAGDDGSDATNSNNTAGSANTGTGSTTSRQACLGTDLLLDHGFTQSELDSLHQGKRLTYLDRLEYRDTDGDGLFDHEEALLGTDPNKADTDGDGHSDIIELAFGYDPLQKNQRRPFAESLNDPTLWANQIMQMFRYALSRLNHISTP